MPLIAQSQNIANAANTPAAPQAIADRVDLLHRNGHAWMPADMQTTI
jgi:hypothetical protein